jgi:AcrR family transcriptional regulator
MPKQARAIATRESIIRAAGLVFAEKTYATATMSDVISEAGVTQGALYFHFDSKWDLAVALIRSQHEKSISIPSELTGLRALIVMSGALAEQIRTDPVVQAGLRLSTESSELFPEYASKPYMDWIEACTFYMEQAIADGEVDPRFDAATTARYIMSAFTGVQVVSRALTGWDDLNERLEEMWEAVIRGVASASRADDLVALASEVRNEAGHPISSDAER